MERPTGTLADDKTAVVHWVDDPPEEVFAPGRTIGRFTILREVGSGGMGSVLAAYDERLDRQIAIKVVQSLSAGTEARARLLREARTLAQLSHPNVVAVYDAGEYAGHVYIAMELVAGDTLRTWLRAHKRPWREIVAVFVQAARGLAAAHGLGIVHRDFKPANVIVGADGRVRVLDFGLAREREAALVEADGDAGASRSIARRFVSEALTVAGSICGTPAYMAPEQLLSGPVDARTDVFALSVALYEALFGVRPFASALDARQSELAELLLEPRPLSPPRGEVPGWLRAEVLRGLAIDPERRHPTMDAFIAALSRDPSRRMRGIGLGLAGGLLAAGGYAAALGGGQDACEAARAEEAAFWSPPIRERVATSLRAAGERSAAATDERVLVALDDYVRRWQDVEVGACREHASGRHDAALHGLQTTCLDRRRDAFEALIERVNAGATPEVLALALEAALDLPAPEHCDDVGALTAAVPPPEDPATAAEVLRIRKALASAGAALRFHHFTDGLAITEPLLRRAEATGYLPVLAETAYVHGRLLETRESDEEAARSLRRGLWLAERVRDDALVARAMAHLIRVLSGSLRRPEEARAFRDHADALIYRLGDASAEAGEVRVSLATLLIDEGRYDEAEHLLTRVLHDLTAHHGGGAEEARRTRAMLAYLAMTRGQTAEAKRLYRELIADLERIFGPEHPRLIRPLFYLAFVQLSLGEHHDALTSAERALAIVDGWYGPGHPEGDQSLAMRSRIIAALGRPREAAAALDPLIDAMLRRGAPAAKTAVFINTRGAMRGRYGDWSGALADFRAAQVRLARDGDEDPPITATLLANTAEALLHTGVTDGVRTDLARAVELLDRHGEPPDTDLRLNIATLGAYLDVLEGRPAAALTVLHEVDARIPANDAYRDDLRRLVDEATIDALHRLGRVDEADAHARRTLTWLEGKGPELYVDLRVRLQERLASARAPAPAAPRRP